MDNLVLKAELDLLDRPVHKDHVETTDSRVLRAGLVGLVRLAHRVSLDFKVLPVHPDPLDHSGTQDQMDRQDLLGQLDLRVLLATQVHLDLPDYLDLTANLDLKVHYIPHLSLFTTTGRDNTQETKDLTEKYLQNYTKKLNYLTNKTRNK